MLLILRNIKTAILNSIRALIIDNSIERFLSSTIYKNKWNSIILSRFTPNYSQFAKKSFRSFERYGLKFRVDVSDYLGHYVYFGFHDQAHSTLLHLAKNAAVILDVGSNIGYTALCLAQKSSANVHAFEPDTYNFEQLHQNCLLNPNTKVYDNNLGLGRKKDKAKLIINTEDNLSGNRISNDASDNFSWINITTIDSYIQEHEISDVSLIKIDVEGFEYEVLLGALETIKVKRPILFIEIDDENLKAQNSSAKEVIAFLEQFYSNLQYAQNNLKVDSSANFYKCHFDVIAQNSPK